MNYHNRPWKIVSFTDFGKRKAKQAPCAFFTQTSSENMSYSHPSWCLFTWLLHLAITWLCHASAKEYKCWLKNYIQTKRYQGKTTWWANSHNPQLQFYQYCAHSTNIKFQVSQHTPVGTVGEGGRSKRGKGEAAVCGVGTTITTEKTNSSSEEPNQPQMPWFAWSIW